MRITGINYRGTSPRNEPPKSIEGSPQPLNLLENYIGKAYIILIHYESNGQLSHPMRFDYIIMEIEKFEMKSTATIQNSLSHSQIFNSPRIVLLLIMLLAMTVRLVSWHLTDSLYRDTVNFIVHAEKFSTESLRDTVQEPLHPLIIRAVHEILFPRDSSGPVLNQPAWELTIFAVGMLFSLVALWLLYAIGRYLHSPAAGLWAAFFLAIIPYGTAYSIHGLSELPFLAMLLLSLFLVMKSLKNSIWLILPAGISAAMMVLCRKEGLILIPLVLLYLLCMREITFNRKTRLAELFLLGAGILFIAYLLLGGRFYWASDYIAILKKLIHRRFNMQACLGDSHYILALHWFRRKYDFLTMPLAGWFKLSGFVPAILFLIYLFKRRSLKMNPGAGLLILFAALHLLMVISQNIVMNFFVTRYLFPVCIVLFPIAGAMLAEILIKINAKCWKPAEHLRASHIFAFIFAAILVAETIQNCYTDRHPEILAAARSLREKTPSNAFVFTTDHRIPFYGNRAFKNIKFYPLTKQIPDSVFSNDPVFLVLDYKFPRQKEVQLQLNQMKTNRNILAEPVQNFTRKNGVIQIYRLSKRIPSESPG
jgi:hypothetical protein